MYHDYVMSPYLFMEALTTLRALWSRRSTTQTLATDPTARPVCIYRPTPGVRRRKHAPIAAYAFRQ